MTNRNQREVIVTEYKSQVWWVLSVLIHCYPMKVRKLKRSAQFRYCRIESTDNPFINLCHVCHSKNLMQREDASHGRCIWKVKVAQHNEGNSKK